MSEYKDPGPRMIAERDEKIKLLEKKLAEMTTRNNQLLGAYETCEGFYKDFEKKLAISVEALEQYEPGCYDGHDYFAREISHYAKEALTKIRD